MTDFERYKESVLAAMAADDFATVYSGVGDPSGPNAAGWVRGLCPVHADSSPSFSYHTTTGKYRCFNPECTAGSGDAFDFVGRLTGAGFMATLTALGARFGLTELAINGHRPKVPIDKQRITGWVNALHSTPEVLRWIAEHRGLTAATLRRYEVGWDAEKRRITIPVRDEAGTCWNVRLYDPKAKAKMLNYRSGRHSYGSPARLYGLSELADDTRSDVVICEGEWDALVLRQHGYLAVSGTHGADTFPRRWGRWVAGRDVIVVYDTDGAGRAAARGRVIPVLQGAGAKSVRDVVLPIAGDDGKDVTDFFQQHSDAAERLRELIKATPPTAAKTQIDVTEQHIPTLADKAWAVLENANAPPYLFRHGGQPVRIKSDLDAPTPEVLDVERLRHVLARETDWIVSHGEEVKLVAPPGFLVRDLLARPDIPFPVLEAVIRAPAFASDGSLKTEPGYSAPARTYYAPAAGFTLSPVPDRPTAAEIAGARGLLIEELLGDFPFVGPPELAHAVAALLLPFVRGLIDSPTPLHLIEKPAPGTGATLLTDVLTYPATGAPVAAMTEGRDEDEWRKRITAQLRDGAAAVLIDNLRGGLDSATVSSALTSTIWSDRVLGTLDVTHLLIRCTWIATGNNPELSNEIARRTVRIRLDAQQDRPWLRSEFRHPDLREWVREHRAEIVWAALVLGRAWLVAGKPLPSHRVRLGMFESWADVMGGVMECAGIAGFLGNLDEFYGSADSESDSTRLFLTEWWDTHRGRRVGVKDLAEVAEKIDPPLDLGDGTERSRRIRLGRMIARWRDRSFRLAGGLPAVVQSAGTYQGAQLWKLWQGQGQTNV